MSPKSRPPRTRRGLTFRFLSLLLILTTCVALQVPCTNPRVSSRRHAFAKRGWPLSPRSSSTVRRHLSDVDDDEEEEIEPGKMRVSEIKAELDLRGVRYADCFDKESLVARLEETRATGKADPDILDKFNKQRLEDQFNEEKATVSDQDIDRVVANDGTLPGGMTPEQFQKLTSNPEVMELLQSTKMQEAMKLMMTGGREELESKLKEDKELQETVQKLNSVLGSLQ